MILKKQKIFVVASDQFAKQSHFDEVQNYLDNGWNVVSTTA
jgi:hypothetical protein